MSRTLPAARHTGLSVATSAAGVPFGHGEALTADARDLQEGEWAVFGAVAAVLGIAVSVVAYICGVCGARSFWACMSAVRNYWGAGC